MPAFCLQTFWLAIIKVKVTKQTPYITSRNSTVKLFEHTSCRAYNKNRVQYSYIAPCSKPIGKV
jgi:hypothetical protein